MKKYQIKTGAVISLFISILALLPRIIRFEMDNLSNITQNLFFTFTFSLLCWILLQVLFQSRRFTNIYLRLWVGVWGCIFLSLLHYSFFIQLLPRPIISFFLNDLSWKQRVGIILFRGMMVGGVLSFIIYYFNLLLRTQKIKLEIEHLKQDNLSARLGSLKQQISPHFLFNSLNTLKTLTEEENVKNYVVQLSNVYRYLLHHSERHLALIEEELNFVKSYFYILQERFEDALLIDIKVSPETLKCSIPPLSLQILVENSIKHNVISLNKPLTISIFNENGYLVVQNNLQPKKSVEESTGIGLKNIISRYALLADKSVEISQTSHTFTVKLPLLACHKYSS